MRDLWTYTIAHSDFCFWCLRRVKTNLSISNFSALSVSDNSFCHIIHKLTWLSLIHALKMSHELILLMSKLGNYFLFGFLLEKGNMICSWDVVSLLGSQLKIFWQLYWEFILFELYQKDIVVSCKIGQLKRMNNNFLTFLWHN